MLNLTSVEQMNIVTPAIEQLFAETMQFSDTFINQQIHDHAKLAHRICTYLDAPTTAPDLAVLRQNYYDAVATFLQDPEYRRLLFYLPFTELKHAPDDFKAIYLSTWRRLLSVLDARENFHEGDVYEWDARPGGETERVIKCIHLLPWLVAAEYLTFEDVYRLADLNGNNLLMMQNLRETWPIFQDWQLFSESELEQLQRLTAHASPRVAAAPLYNSERRIAWLESRNGTPAPLFTPTAQLDGPFSSNLASMTTELQTIISQLAPDEIILINGSRLKGYGTAKSDLDIYRLSDIEAKQNPDHNDSDLAHIIYDSIWLGGEQVSNLAEVQRNCLAAYFTGPNHIYAVECLENDLLQYRLLHKGFSHFFARAHYPTERYPQIDGDCPFYDDTYRRIATKLYAKYVFIPQIKLLAHP